MQETNSYYEVTVRQRVPYLTVFLWRLFSFFSICFILVYLIMYPVKDASPELVAMYFSFLLPSVLQKFIIFSVIGFGISFILYLRVRLYKKAIVTFDSNQINVTGESIQLKIDVTTIKKVTFIDDSREVGGQLHEKFIAYFQQRKEKSIRIRLSHYIQSEYFMDEFLKYPNVEYDFSNVEYSPDLENEI